MKIVFEIVTLKGLSMAIRDILSTVQQLRGGFTELWRPLASIKHWPLVNYFTRVKLFHVSALKHSAFNRRRREDNSPVTKSSAHSNLSQARSSFLQRLVCAEAHFCFPFIRAFLQRVVCRRLAARFYSLSPLKP